MNAPPPLIVVVHPRERKAKCTVRPLRNLTGLEFRQFPLRRPIPEGYVRLSLDGPALSRDDADCGLLVLDGTWRWAAQMESWMSDVPVRSLPPFETAYPRSSKVFQDPAEGLATVEAIFVAQAILGRSTQGILDQYHWREDFLRRNAPRFQSLGVMIADVLQPTTADRPAAQC